MKSEVVEYGIIACIGEGGQGVVTLTDRSLKHHMYRSPILIGRSTRSVVL